MFRLVTASLVFVVGLFRCFRAVGPCRCYKFRSVLKVV